MADDDDKAGAQARAMWTAMVVLGAVRQRGPMMPNELAEATPYLIRGDRQEALATLIAQGKLERAELQLPGRKRMQVVYQIPNGGKPAMIFAPCEPEATDAD